MLGFGSRPKSQTQNIKKISDSDPNPDPKYPKKLDPDPNSDPDPKYKKNFRSKPRPKYTKNLGPDPNSDPN